MMQPFEPPCIVVLCQLCGQTPVAARIIARFPDPDSDREIVRVDHASSFCPRCVEIVYWDRDYIALDSPLFLGDAGG